MRLRFLAWTALAALSMTGCNKAESPAAVQQNVKKADQSAVANIVAAEHRADVKIADANADVVVTRAEADHKIATAQCDGLAGDAQKACKDQADAALDTAKANAKAAKADHD